MKIETLSNIRRLVGAPVLLPIQTGQKKPTLSGWQKLTPESCDESHERKLLAADAVGVALGPVSDGLITVDMDHDAAAEEFLALNPWMAGTLTTKGQRGCNFWFRMIGPYPERTARIVTQAGAAIGEFRSGGGQTVIAGRHPSGMDYQFLNEAPPLRIPLGALRWPDSWCMAGESAADFCLRCCRSGLGDGVHGRRPHGANFGQGLCPSSEGRQRERKAEVNADSSASSGTEETRGIETPPREVQMAKLYERFIARRIRPEPHRRNETVVKAGAFLYHAVAEEVAVILLMRFYDDNAALWNDSREQHEREVRAHLRNVADRFAETLPLELRFSYSCLNTSSQRAAARIAMALAKDAEARGKPPLTFFLSYDDAAARLGVSTSGAYEVMKLLLERGLIMVVDRGRKREAGKPGRATLWRWVGPTADPAGFGIASHLNHS